MPPTTCGFVLLLLLSANVTTTVSGCFLFFLIFFLCPLLGPFWQSNEMEKNVCCLLAPLVGALLDDYGDDNDDCNGFDGDENEDCFK